MLEKVQQESEALLRYGDSSKAAALAQAELAKYREKNLKVTPDLEREIRGWAEQVARVQEFNEALKKVKSELTDMAVTFVQGLAHGEKAADLLNKAITRLSDKLLEMATRKLVEQAVGSLLGGIGGAGSGGGLIAGIFGSAHTGGVVGKLSSSRVAHPSVFAGSHRYHTGGLVGDEVPVIARRGEGIFTPAQMRALGSRGSSIVVSPVINITSQGGDVNEQRVLGKRVAQYVKASVRQALIEERRGNGLLAAGAV